MTRQQLHLTRVCMYQIGTLEYIPARSRVTNERPPQHRIRTHTNSLKSQDFLSVCPRQSKASSTAPPENNLSRLNSSLNHCLGRREREEKETSYGCMYICHHHHHQTLDNQAAGCAAISNQQLVQKIQITSQ